MCGVVVGVQRQSQLSRIPPGQDKFAFSSDVTGHVLWTLIKTSSFERQKKRFIFL